MYSEVKELELPKPPFLKKWRSVYLFVVVYLISLISVLYYLGSIY